MWIRPPKEERDNYGRDREMNETECGSWKLPVSSRREPPTGGAGNVPDEAERIPQRTALWLLALKGILLGL